MAENTGSGALWITTGDVDGGRFGVAGVNSRTDFRIDTSAGDVQGGERGIYALQQGSGVLSITTADVTGTTGIGIFALNEGADLAIDSSAGHVTGVGFGIFADQQSAADIALMVNRVTGDTGIRTLATTGDTLITLGSSAVVTGTQTAGIVTTSTGGAISVVGNSGEVSGAMTGVYARSGGGDITIDTIDRIIGNAGNGLDLASGGGAISVSEIDAIMGIGGNGILANAEGGAGGDIAIASSGDTMGSLAGIAAVTDVAGEIAMDLSGLVYGAQNGIDVSTQGGGVTIANSGTLSGVQFALVASGADTGPILLDNSGTLASAIQFASADDQLLNSGLFAAAGLSDFGEGDDLLDNGGTISVLGIAEFASLEQFANSGLVSMVDDLAGGSLSLSGDFIGNGGQLALDIDLAAGTGDLLTIAGAATGTTELMFNVLNFDAPLGQNVVVIDAAAGTEAAAFALSPAQTSVTPFLSFDLAFDAAANDFLFGLVVEPKVFEATKFGEGAQALWYRSADVWSDHRANTRFAKQNGGPVWAVFHGLAAQHDEGFSAPTGVSISDAVLDRSQDFFGVQAGVEKPLGDKLTIGVTGGYLESHLKFDVSSTRTEFEALNIGLALSYLDGGLFADALIKYDDISGRLYDATIGGFEGEIDGNAFGARLELGYRTQGTFFIEPRVSLEFQQADLDDIAVANQRFEFDGFDGLRGAAGARLGGTSKLSERSNLTYYLDASAVREFEGEGRVRFVLPFDELEFENNPAATYAHLEAGLSIDTDGPVSGFFQVEADISSSYASFGGSAGVRIRF